MRIRLTSVQPVVAEERDGAALKTQEEVNDIQGDEMEEDEDEENSSEYGMIEAGRWGE